MTPEPIRTHHWLKPIPLRCFDWCAHRDSWEPGMGEQGWGATEQEAVDDLMQQEWENDPTPAG